MKTSQKWFLGVLMTWLLGCSSSSLGFYQSQTKYKARPTKSIPGAVPDFQPIYRKMGLASAPLPIAFVGSVAFFASPNPDTTLMIVSISIPNRGLTFQKVKNGADFETTYEVTISVKQDTTEIQRQTRTTTIVVDSAQTFARTDIVFQEVLRLTPGRYTASYMVRDVLGSHAATDSVMLRVPRFDEYSVSKPVIVSKAMPRTDLSKTPFYIASSRAFAQFGIDTEIQVYLEAYNEGTGDVPIELSLRDSINTLIWIDTVPLKRHNRFASGIFSIPITNEDLGIYTITTRHVGTPPVTSSSSRVPMVSEGVSTVSPLITVSTVFIGFGSDLPVMDFQTMSHYLQLFPVLHTMIRGGTGYNEPYLKPGLIDLDRLAALTQRTATTKLKFESWQEYFARVREANHRYAKEGPEGWLTDRGSVFVVYGEPFKTFELESGDRRFWPHSQAKKGIPLVGWWWGHNKYFLDDWSWRASRLKNRSPNSQLQFVFYDKDGTGQWRLVPTSKLLFDMDLTHHMILHCFHDQSCD